MHFDYITSTRSNPLQFFLRWPCLLEKCWKTSEQDTFTTWPTSARSQQRISSHSVLQPKTHRSKRWQSTRGGRQSISPAQSRMHDALPNGLSFFLFPFIYHPFDWAHLRVPSWDNPKAKHSVKRQDVEVKLPSEKTLVAVTGSRNFTWRHSWSWFLSRCVKHLNPHVCTLCGNQQTQFFHLKLLWIVKHLAELQRTKKGSHSNLPPFTQSSRSTIFYSIPITLNSDKNLFASFPGMAAGSPWPWQ